MKASRKKRYQRWIHRLLTSVICVAFIGFFAVVWQVHAFDLQKALPKVADKALAAHAQTQVAPVDSTGTSASIAASPKPDRWSDGDVVSALSSFYQTIITLMGFLLGVIGIVAVLTLRFLSKLAAEDMAHEAAKGAVRHYLETRQFGENVKYAIEETGLAYELEDLAKKMEAIKRIVEKKGSAGRDDEEVDGVVT
ncbi:hypothetical protein EA658_14350 [Pseudoxanthomonas winnipegensis]|uniref:Transmembrane protein n=1 Tax=Pseudoxanthomonas winnipegensis TaxID=2480810 RepID=A0ABY1WBB8_9GAMM|nr:hypothetical protein [Pseudoxanthomonas winnipegensis]TAA10877.1 hypothetical protein EA659_05760 [Pseudoxanthomonas winnipegensis]TAA18303.1 hypothetical protein EA658_14350 [Pseudoxanthomonas winnipegensis]TAH74322.1 hypothetical protein EA657_02400 [Pseudoxanthomonas winnipegensis]